MSASNKFLNAEITAEKRSYILFDSRIKTMYSILKFYKEVLYGYIKFEKIICY